MAAFLAAFAHQVFYLRNNLQHIIQVLFLQRFARGERQGLEHGLLLGIVFGQAANGPFDAVLGVLRQIFLLVVDCAKLALICLHRD